ncbi:MAG: hypothetical protein EOP02_04820 [Proteobacteria bacterium]|nr:MAG: hypothetical protein EOP02_04820 [Pseudomonadota bacterium]
MQGNIVGRVDFSWIASPLRLSARTLLRQSDLEKHAIITMTEGSGLTRAIETWSAERSIALQRTLGCNSLVAIVALVLGLPHHPGDLLYARGHQDEQARSGR